MNMKRYAYVCMYTHGMHTEAGFLKKIHTWYHTRATGCSATTTAARRGQDDMTHHTQNGCKPQGKYHGRRCNQALFCSAPMLKCQVPSRINCAPNCFWKIGGVAPTCGSPGCVQLAFDFPISSWNLETTLESWIAKDNHYAMTGQTTCGPRG